MRLTEKPRTLAEIRTDVQWPAELQTVMDKALANHPADRYQHVSQFGRELVTAVATMPESAFTSTGTLELSPIAAAAQYRSASARRRCSVASRSLERRAPGSGIRGREVRQPRRRHLRRARAADPRRWRWLVVLESRIRSRRRSRSATAPPSAPSPRRRSDRRQHEGDSAVDNGARTTRLPRRQRLPPSTVPPRNPARPSRRETHHSADQLDDMLAPDPRGSQRRQAADERRRVRRRGGSFRNAQDKIAPLARKYADVPQIRALRREINEALSQNHAACKAERDLALAHGSASAPDCP